MQGPISVDHVVSPLSLVHVSVCPIVLSVAVDFVFRELTHVSVSTWEEVLSLSLLGPELVFPGVNSAVLPLLLSEPLLDILSELTFVKEPIFVPVLSLAFRAVVFPFPFIHISQISHQSPVSIGLVVFEKALVVRAIDPDFESLSFSLSFVELTEINGVGILVGSEDGKVFELFFLFVDEGFEVLQRLLQNVEITRRNGFELLELRAVRGVLLQVLQQIV